MSKINIHIYILWKKSTISNSSENKLLIQHVITFTR